MTDKELRRSSKKELIEMLYYMRKELDDARVENERLNARFDSLLIEAMSGKSSGSVSDESPSADAGEVLQPEPPESDNDEKS